MLNDRHIREETAFPGALAVGDSGKGVRRIQEWLCFHGSAVPIDDGFQEATARALRSFRTQNGLEAGDALDGATWDRLVEPLRRALADPAMQAEIGLPALVLRVALQHVDQHPVELGGDNRGPWVRLYMSGNDGPEWRWCAGFVSLVLRHAAALLNAPMPIAGSFSCDRLAEQAKQANRFVPGDQVRSGQVAWSALAPCAIFLVRRTDDDWTHTGLALEGEDGTFVTIEGNRNDGGSANGTSLLKRTRNLDRKDFIVLS